MAGALKTRDIRLIIKQKGLERGVQEILEAQNEMLVDQNRNLLMLAQNFDRMTSTLQTVVNIASDMKDLADKISKDKAHAELGVTTQSLGSGDE